MLALGFGWRRDVRMVNPTTAEDDLSKQFKITFGGDE